MHLSDELLSSYLDGELSPTQAHRASEHLRDCPRCAQALGTFAALDQELAAPPALSCSQAAPFLSAKLDAELGAEEAEIATAHLATCAGCRADVARWSAAEVALKTLPASRPSARVDAFVAALGREPERRVAATGLGRAWPVPALALATAISLVLVLSLPQAGAPVATQPDQPLVAAAQESVFNPNTNTLYYLKTDSGEVIAIDPQTGAQKGVIKVGGKPTALALNLATNTVAVLDSSHKTVHEIDGALTTVQSSTSVDVGGTPTSLQVDTKGNVVVGAVVSTGGGPAASASGVGVIATIDGGTGQVGSVHQIDIAPSVIVIDPNGKRALLVSAKSTILADAATYAPLGTYPGGIGAAFSVGRDDFAVLSAGAKGATVTFARGGAQVVLGGVPRAITSLPGGGFAVLADTAGTGLITVVNSDGVTSTTLAAPANAKDLAYDSATRKFSVIGAVGLVSVALPTATQAPPIAVAGSPLPTALTTPSAAPSAAPSTSPTPTPTPSPAPTEPVVVVAPPERESNVPAGARVLWPGTYFVGLPAGDRPVASIFDGKRIWYLDDANRVSVLHVMASGERYQITALPQTAIVTGIAIAPNHVYFVDGAANVLYVLTINTEQVTSVTLPRGMSVTALAGSPDERVWFATKESGLVAYDPRTRRIETVPAGLDLAAVATDAIGRVWTASRQRQAIDVYDPFTGKLTEIALTHGGALSALAVDRSNTVWVGTDTGQTFAVKGGVPAGTGSAEVSPGLVGRPITGFVMDMNGGVYFVSRSSSALAYGAVRGAGVVRLLPSGSTEPMFDPLGRAWSSDRAAGGLYVTLAGGG
jgi:anti-sigma factor RsiW/sugar lactone lactonase YvrE